jgi:hypothetical protein
VLSSHCKGNHDLGLDKDHPKHLPESVDLFTSAEARKSGIHYLNEEVRHVASYAAEQSSEPIPIRVYGNPRQPDFLNTSYAFTYLPYPSEGSIKAWKSAPNETETADIWVTHSPPKDHLDAIMVEPLIGCEAQRQKIEAAKPMLCVFGHYHYSWGIERVRWEDRTSMIKYSKILTLSPERQNAEMRKVPVESNFDFTGNGEFESIDIGKETIFVNAAWMTMKKRAIQYRNQPFVVTVDLAARYANDESTRPNFLTV